MITLSELLSECEPSERNVEEPGDVSNSKTNKVLNINFDGHNLQISDGHLRIIRPRVNTLAPGDYGCDPLPDGTFRMVPSGDIVSYEESRARLNARAAVEAAEPPCT